MAQVVYRVFTSVLCFLTVLCACKAMNVGELSPIVESIHLVNETKITNPNGEIFHKLLVELRGSNFYSGMKVRATTNMVKSGCSENKHLGVDDNFCEIWSNSTFSVMTLLLKSEPGLSEKSYFVCVKYVHRTSPDKGFIISTLSSEIVKWIHQGDNVGFQTKNVEKMPASKSVLKPSSTGRQRRDWKKGEVDDEEAIAPNSGLTQVHLFGFRLESSESNSETEGDGVPQLKIGTVGVLRLFGHGWTDSSRFVLTTSNITRGTHCEFPVGDSLKLESNPSENTALLSIRMPAMGVAGATYFLCAKEEAASYINSSVAIPRTFIHLGNESYLQIRSYEDFLPLWLSITIILICLSFSSLFSGLNLGLMSLDRTDLKIICNTGTEAERRYARAILPVREHGNYLLCSILLGNVMVNSTLTIIIENLTSGLVSVIASTLAIVIFGEISPQAVCSRHGLAIGAKTIYITKVVMILTFPLSYPISSLLDFMLGEEIGAVYTRERLKELLTTEFNDLENDEVNIISGALELRKKSARDVMTKLENVYMLSFDAILDFETVTDIMKQGFSRIPVYDGSRNNIVTMLFIKDLALVDPDDNTPLKTLCQFYQNPCYFVFEDTRLDVLFKQFKSGIQGHMAFVHRVNNEGEGDPFYETVGLITLEDVIEELIQAEINDETDVWTDNNFKKRRNQRSSARQDFSAFAERSENQHIHISPQLTLATFQFLSASVDPFKPENISETILSRLLKQDIIYHIKMKKEGNYQTDPNTIIYQQGKASDYFVLILEGRVEVTLGKENLVFESGPFTYFGLQALTQNIGVGEAKFAESPTTPASQALGSLQSVNLDSMLRYTFVPDYTVRAVTEVFYLRIKRSFYMAAKRATLMEKSKKEESNAGENFDAEVEKLLHSSFADEDRRSRHGSPDITRTQSQRGSPGHTSPTIVLNNGSLCASSEPVLVSPSRTPKSSDAISTEERSKLLKSAES